MFYSTTLALYVVDNFFIILDKETKSIFKYPIDDVKVIILEIREIESEIGGDSKYLRIVKTSERQLAQEGHLRAHYTFLEGDVTQDIIRLEDYRLRLTKDFQLQEYEKKTDSKYDADNFYNEKVS